MLAEAMKNHLTEDLIPFWKSLKDDEYGGYYGLLSLTMELEKKAEKGCILNSRILWFFSNCYSYFKEESLLKYADHAYDFLKNFFLDSQYGGVYWSVDYQGNPLDTTKHTYNQAFAVYALSSYYEASKKAEALQLSEEILQTMETYCKDAEGYLEAFHRDFSPADNDKLSENGIMAEKTMNTMLHVFEAYAELYRVSENKIAREQLIYILSIFEKKVYNPVLGRQEVFFNQRWDSLIDLYSYGHDIETSWLMERGLDILGDEKLKERIKPLTRIMAENVLKYGYKNHALLNEAENGKQDATRNWWVQAEAVLGFYHSYQVTEDIEMKEKFLLAAKDIWAFIQEYMIDQRGLYPYGREWYSALDERAAVLPKAMVEPWKCPYHNGRMCLEIIKREEKATL